MLYDQVFIASLPKLNPVWKSPLLLYIVHEATSDHKKLKQLIEKWYAKINEEKKAAYASRLKSQDDQELIAQIFEFLVYEFCEKLAPIDLDPELESGKTPELIWSFNDQKIILDVLTIFNENKIEKSSQAVDELLNYLSDIEHCFSLGVIMKDIEVGNVKKKKIKNKLVNFLDGLEQNENQDLQPSISLSMEECGFEGEFIALKKECRKKVNFSLQEPVQEIEALNSIKKRIKSKVTKYKWDGPLLVALCKNADFGADIEEVTEILYGHAKARYNSQTKEVIERFEWDGLYMPRDKGKPQNTSLSGVLYCELKWKENFPQIEVKYLDNPHAKYPVNLPIERAAPISFSQ